MNDQNLTAHAIMRLAQRALQPNDLDLIVLIGTEVESGYLVRRKDCQAVERELRQLTERIKRLSGARVVFASDRIVTAYHASRRKQRRLLRPSKRRA